MSQCHCAHRMELDLLMAALIYSSGMRLLYRLFAIDIDLLVRAIVKHDQIIKLKKEEEEDYCGGECEK